MKPVPGVLVRQRQEDARVPWGPGCDLPKRGSSQVQIVRLEDLAGRNKNEEKQKQMVC